MITRINKKMIVAGKYKAFKGFYIVPGSDKKLTKGKKNVIMNLNESNVINKPACKSGGLGKVKSLASRKTTTT